MWRARDWCLVTDFGWKQPLLSFAVLMRYYCIEYPGELVQMDFFERAYLFDKVQQKR